MKRIKLIVVYMVAILGLFACSKQKIIQPTATLIPTVSSTPTATPFLISTPYPTATPPSWVDFDSEMVLPAPLYFVAGAVSTGSCPLAHLVRLSQVGGTSTIIGPCFIWGGLHGFDISPVDGSIVIAGQGALWFLDAEGNDPYRLIDGLPNPEIQGRRANISEPAWSPDGQWIAYADGGMRMVKLASGERIDIIEDECPDWGLAGSGDPCTYGGIYYQTPEWSPDSTMLLFRSQNADDFSQMLYSISGSSSPNRTPGTRGVDVEDIAWGRNSTTLLFDYWSPLEPRLPDLTEPAFVRFNWITGNTEVIWFHGDRADPVFASAGNNPWQVRYPFETSDGRILIFQAEPCDSESCYKYALVEVTLTVDGYDLRVLRHNALPSGAREVVWHDSGEYIAFVIGSYYGPWYIAVMRVSTGEMFMVIEEEQMPSHLKWGNQ